MSYLEHLKEAIKSLPELYHGRTVKDTAFDYKFIGRQEAIDEQGPGFYFTNSKDDARSYAQPNGIIITVKYNFKKLIEEKNKPNKNDVIKMLKMSPMLDDILNDWGYDPGFSSKQEAFNALFESVYDPNNAKETFLSVWGDGYRRGNNDVQYVKNMVSLGYDGLVVEKPDAGKWGQALANKSKDVMHIIAYDPSKIEIINVEDYKEAKEEE
jgi:hypothetical protein